MVSASAPVRAMTSWRHVAVVAALLLASPALASIGCTQNITSDYYGYAVAWDCTESSELVVPTAPSSISDFSIAVSNVSPNSTEALALVNGLPPASSVSILLDNATISATKLTGDLGNVGLIPSGGGSYAVSIEVRDSTLIQAVLVLSGYWVVDGDLAVTLKVVNSTIRSSQFGIEGVWAVSGNAVITVQVDETSDLSGSTFLVQGGVLAAGNLVMTVDGQSTASVLANDTSNSAGITGLMAAGEQATITWDGYLGGMSPETTPDLFEAQINGNSSSVAAYAELAVEASAGKLERAQAGQTLLDGLCAGQLSFGSEQFDDVFEIVATYICASSSASTSATYEQIYASTSGEDTGDLSSDADGTSTTTISSPDANLDNSSPLPGNETSGVEDVINNVNGDGSTSDSDTAEAPSSEDLEDSPEAESSPEASATDNLGSDDAEDANSGVVQGGTVTGSVVLGRKLMQLVTNGIVAAPSTAPASPSPSPSALSPSALSPSPSSPDASITVAGVEVGVLFFSEDFGTYIAALAQSSLTSKDYQTVVEDKALMILQAVDDEAATAYKTFLDADTA